MFHSILCATDLSPGGSHAVEVAAKWAEALGAKLDVLHVVPPLISAVPETDFLREIHASIRSDAEGKVDELVRRLEPRVRVKGHVEVGFAHHAIVSAATELGSDMIVVGAGGDRGIARAFLGGVPDRLLRTSQVPVLVVPEDSSVAMPRVLVAPTDLGPAAEPAVRRARALAKELSCEVELVHAYGVPAYVSRDAPVVRDLPRALEERLRSQHPLDDRTRAHVVEGPAAQVIEEVARSTHADLVVMLSRGPSLLASLLLGSVTDRVVRTSRIPVLVLCGDAPAPRRPEATAS